MYKIKEDNTILRKSDGAFIPKDTGNSDYQKFINDVCKNGIEIVEGADYVGVVTYTDARREEYPPIEDQLDKIYHSGVNAWKAEIKKIKDKYPKTQVGVTSIAPAPDWIAEAVIIKQKERYIQAKARLAQVELSAGLKNEQGDYIIRPLPIEVNGERNPMIVNDEIQRGEAQDIILNTPQNAIDLVDN